jgi:ligand-binding sensor domain-containing protein/signal transduction histidine kinase
MCCADAAHAVDDPKQLTQFVRREWRVDGDFPGGPVRTIRQLSDGYLWLGAQKGLIRFDGLNFRVDSSPRPSFQNDQISDLMKGPDGKLWVVFWGAGLLRYNDGRLEGLPSKFGQPGIQVTASFNSQNGSILLADSINGIERVTEDGTKTLAPSNALPGYALVISMAESGNGTIWLGTASQGLFSLNDGHIKAVLSGHPTRRINCLLPTGENSTWFGTANGLFNWDGTRITRVPLPDQVKGAQVLTMLRDRRGNIWVGTARGLVRIDNSGASFFERDSVASGEITSLFEDREGNVWVGGPQGLERISEKTFVIYGQSEGLPKEVNGPVHVDEVGRAWVAPQEGGIDLIDGGSVQHLKSPFLDRNVIYSIASDKSGVWLGTQTRGITRVTYRNGIVTTATYTKADGLAENSVFSVSVGRDGAVWAGTLTGGVSRLKGGKFVTYKRDDGLASNTVSSILETHDGRMWFGTPNGLSSLSNGHWSTYTTQDGLASNNVNSLFEDGFGSLWVGTSAGISVIEHGQIRALPNVPASLHDQIFGFALDPKGRVWVETAAQILCIQPLRLPDGELSSVNVREYDTEDGLPQIEGVRRNQSVAVGGEGKVWFSLRDGVAVVDSESVRDDSVPALSHIDMISADGTTIPLTNSIKIPPSRRRLTFKYTGISLTIPERVRFRYFLEGFDHAWSAPVDAREAVYTNLSPGPYRFRVISRNSDGLWNGPETSIVFRVEPAFWQTMWFRIAVLMMVLLAFWGIFRIRTHALTRQLNSRFQVRLSERSRIARELHDTLLQSMQMIILRFQTVHDLLPENPDKAKQLLEGTLERADIALKEGRNAIMDIRSSSTAQFDLAEVLRSLINEPTGGLVSDRNRTDFCLVWVDGVPREVRLDVRDDICRIAREALHNAIQHAMAQQIRVKITYSDDALRLQVLDNGRGMEPTVLKQGGRAGHWGLVGMRERAARIGATLEISSRPGEGTEILLTLPANLAYESFQTRWWSIFSR